MARTRSSMALRRAKRMARIRYTTIKEQGKLIAHGRLSYHDEAGAYGLIELREWHGKDYLIEKLHVPGYPTGARNEYFVTLAVHAEPWKMKALKYVRRSSSRPYYPREYHDASG